MATAILLVLGGFVTTFRVGMADPVWPTKPWYLFGISWSEPKAGFLIEHTHRLFGFLVGGFASVLALGTWWTEPNPRRRWIGLIGLLALLAIFGEFHRALMKQADQLVIVWPIGLIAAMCVAFVGLLVLAIAGCRVDRKAGPLRLAVVVELVMVMVQGLLGGLRVRLNALAGTDLAAIHGSFAQLVFAPPHRDRCHDEGAKGGADHSTRDGFEVGAGRPLAWSFSHTCRSFGALGFAMLQALLPIACTCSSPSSSSPLRRSPSSKPCPTRLLGSV